MFIVLRKKTAFPRCRAMDRRWNRNTVFLVSCVMTVVRLPISCTSSIAMCLLCLRQWGRPRVCLPTWSVPSRSSNNWCQHGFGRYLRSQWLGAASDAQQFRHDGYQLELFDVCQKGELKNYRHRPLIGRAYSMPQYLTANTTPNCNLSQQ